MRGIVVAVLVGVVVAIAPASAGAHGVHQDTGWYKNCTAENHWAAGCHVRLGGVLYSWHHHHSIATRVHPSHSASGIRGGVGLPAGNDAPPFVLWAGGFLTVLAVLAAWNVRVRGRG